MATLQRTRFAPALWKCRSATVGCASATARFTTSGSSAPCAPTSQQKKRPLLATTSRSTSLKPYVRGQDGNKLFENIHRLASSKAAAKGPSDMYTASFAFFEAIWEAGITHCFVNLGSDHPSIIEAMVKGKREAKGNFPRIITCPNEVCIGACPSHILP